MKKVNSNYIIIALFVAVVIGLIIILNNKEGSSSKKYRYNVVNNASTFFTVEGCVNRYLNSLSKGNIDDIMALIDDKYIESHNLNSENILEHLGRKEGIFTFSAKKMYSEKRANGATYYIYGLIKEELLDTRDYGKDYYIKVNIQEDKHYSIEPLDENAFEEVIK